MKKLLVLSLLSSLAASAFGQGQVTFNNRVTTSTPLAVVAPIYIGSVGGTLASGTDTSLRAALLSGPTGAAAAFVSGSRTNQAGSSSSQGALSLIASPSTGATWTTFRTGTLAGYVAVGTDSARDAGVPFGATAQFQVVAWNGGYNT